MAQVIDLLNQAAKLIGALTQGTGLNQSEIDDLFAQLNIIVDAWNADPTKHYAVLTETHALTAHTGTYTLGSGGTYSSTRPVYIHSAAIILSGIKHPMDLINKAQYDAILEPTGEMQIPRKLYDDGGFPTRTIKIWPVPSGTPDLEVASPQIIPPFGATNSALALPPAYYKALLYTLAVDAGPTFRMQIDSTLPVIAKQAQDDMKIPNFLNMAQLQAQVQDAGPSRGAPGQVAQ